jgi:hypothetical protein
MFNTPLNLEALYAKNQFATADQDRNAKRQYAEYRVGNQR